MFAIRITNKQDQGIGHLMRMKHLADALKLKQIEVHIILDDVCSFSRSFFSDFNVIDVDWVNYERDAFLTINYMHRESLSHLIIDSYTLPLEYEKQVKEEGFALTVIDDNEQPHVCDFLIDYKWVGPDTESRYESLVPEHCVRLLGPNYCILNPVYRTVKKSPLKSEFPIRILFSLGGGGDLLVIKKILDALPMITQKKVSIDIVIGPYAINEDKICEMVTANSNINILKNLTCLKAYYEKASLFIGALGTSFYECVATQTPAITFSVGENQHNDVEILQGLGHYLHINELKNRDFPKLGQLIDVVIKQLPRLQNLAAKRDVTVDGYGAERIASALTGRTILCNKTHNQRQLNSIVDFEENLSIYEIDDTHINSYLIARNLPNNSVRMTVNNVIQPLEHYIWWFTQSRFNYVLTQGHDNKCVDCLYIWHNLYKENYLYGGWFACNEDVSFPMAMLALQWQLEFCNASHPNAIWLAVIHKENKFVNLLNKYMGFVETPVSSKEYEITQQLFPLADEQFNFVMWNPNEQ